MTAHRPQEIFRLLKLAQLILGQQPAINEFGHALNAVHIFADPEQGVQIAQAALALFQIWFDDIAAVPHANMARIAFAQLFSAIGPRRPSQNFATKTGNRFVIQRRITPNIASLKQCGSDGQVCLGHADHFIERPARMADFQSQIPQRVEHRFDDLL